MNDISHGVTMTYERIFVKVSIEEFITFLSPNMDYPRFKIKSLMSIDILEHRAFIKYCMQARKSPMRPKGCYMLLEIANK